MSSFVFMAFVLAHLKGYKTYYIRILTTASSCFIMKSMIKAIDKEKSEIIRFNGWALTGAEALKLLNAINDNAKGGADWGSEAEKILGGWVGKGLGSLLELLK